MAIYVANRTVGNNEKGTNYQNNENKKWRKILHLVTERHDSQHLNCIPISLYCFTEHIVNDRRLLPLVATYKSMNEKKRTIK